MKYYFLLIFSFILAGSSAQTDDYSQLLLSGINTIKFFDADHGIAFGNGTMIRTEDGGNNWEYVELAVPKWPEGFVSCAILDENTAIIAGNESVLLKTIDKGETWSPIAIEIEGFEDNISVDFINSQIGFLSCNTNGVGIFDYRFLLKTIDGGETWTVIETASPGNSTNTDMYSINFINETVGFRWFLQHIYKTVDGGLTWTQIDNPSGNGVFTVKPVAMIKNSDNGMLFATFVEHNKIYQSADEGQTWQEVTALSSENGVSILMPAFEIKDNKLIAVALINAPTNLRNFIIYDIAASSIITAQPINTTMQRPTDFVIGNDGVFFILEQSHYTDYGFRLLKTNNTGAQWTEISSFIFKTNPYNSDIRFFKNSEGIYTIGKVEYQSTFNTFTLYVSTNNGATWKQKVEAVALDAKLLRAEGDYISYARYANPNNFDDGFALYESVDLGETWQVTAFQHPEPYMNSLQSWKQYGDNILTSGTGYSGYISFNKGQNWIPLPTPEVENIDSFSLKIISENEIYAWGSVNNWPENYDYHLFRSTNMAQTWEQVVVIPDNNGADLGAYGSNTFFGESYAIVSTGGDTYFRIDLELNSYTAIEFNHPGSAVNNVYIQNENFKILNELWFYRIGYSWYKSTDNALTWTRMRCVLCEENIHYDPLTENIYTYGDDQGVERLSPYNPQNPDAAGRTDTQTGTANRYYATDTNLSSNEWLLESGGVITNISNPDDSIEVTWTTPGIHILKVRSVNSYGQSDYKEITVTVTGELSTDYEDLLANITVVPNPFTNNLNIKLNNQYSEISKVRIISITGQVIYTATARGDMITIDNLDFLEHGVYFLSVVNGNNISINKIIKH